MYMYMYKSSLYALYMYMYVFTCSYLNSCQAVITEVYEKLMLPLPSDLSSSPDRPLSPDPSATEEGESSEECTPFLSLEEAPPMAPKVADLGSKRSVHHP